MTKPRALVISFSNLGTDPRVHRQIGALATRFEVTATGHAPSAVPGVEFCSVPAYHWTEGGKLASAALLKLGQFERVYWSSESVRAALAALSSRRFELVVANDILALPLASRLGQGAKVLFDAHEYAPLEFEESWRWRFFLKRYNEYLCGRYLPLADAAITVCDGIAEEYRRVFGARMEIVRNAPPFQNLQPSLDEKNNTIRLVHHGGAIPSRQLETMVEAMRHLDQRFTLDFVLVPSVPRYLERLKSLAAGDPRIRFVPPVPMQELPRALNRYDAGIYLLPPNNFNNRHALPNKFFEFIQARLALVIGPSPEMAKLVRAHGCGVVADDFSPRSIAAGANALEREGIERLKQRSHEAARVLCFENEAATLHAVLDRLVAR